MLRGLNSLFRKDSGLKYQYTVSVHSLTLATNLPWHSEKVWYHDNAKECISLPASCKELMIVWKCGTKLAATGTVEANPESTDQLVWGQELGMICTLVRKSNSSDSKSSFRPKKAKFKLLWRGSKSAPAPGVRHNESEENASPLRLGRWRPLAAGTLDLALFASAGDSHESVELKLLDRKEKALGVLHLSVSSKWLKDSRARATDT
eukprot:CAMPEP_0172154516 /NCGR_PEP_ID=MMETSP1050-20130122/2082_1 /TAXON_ID=233186 /ORGANISM="Cryptomonas curvata, Strain CCAP979/52" /LENGTH=205 /DNA_ID=CAMNT_0012823249 /DNA_START=144 /DNA_END=757 /DNA_ORIENTATION=-